MCKCIYCNSDDLNVSDIIPFALTGCKITKRFICCKHNKYTNDHYEKIAIKNLDFFRNALGLTTRDGERIKYNADLVIDGVKIPNVRISDRASLYEDKKRLFPTEHNGQKVLIGNVDLLGKKKGVSTEEIKPIDMSNAIASIKFSIANLLASKEMIFTIAKIAYEWHCYVNNVCDFKVTKYGDIVHYILGENNADFVEVVIDGHVYQAIDELSDFGTHSLFEYVDIDGYFYVILCFWGIIAYKVRIYNTHMLNNKITNTYDLYMYRLDGTKGQTSFGTSGKSHFTSLPPSQAINKHHKSFISRLDQLTKTTVLSFSTMKQLVKELRQAISEYKRNPDNIARFLDYESSKRIIAIRILKILTEHKDEYDYSITFNENIKNILQTKEIFVMGEDENSSFITDLVSLHNKGMLLSTVNDGLSMFDSICKNELQE